MSVTRTNAAGAIATIIAQEALGALSRYSHMAALVSRDYDEQVASHGEAVKIYKRGSLAAQSKAAGSAITVAAPSSPSDVTVTLDQHKVVPFQIEDVARFLARPDLQAGYGEDAAIAISESVDDALLALATDAAVTTQTGAAGTAPTKNTIIDTREALTIGKAPRSNRNLVLGATTETAFLKDVDLGDASKSGFSLALLDQLPVVYGFRTAVNQGVTITAGTPNRTNNLAFHRDAIVLATRPLAAPPVSGIDVETISAHGFTIRVMSSYDHKAMAVLVTLDVLFGVKIVRPEWVVRVAS